MGTHHEVFYSSFIILHLHQLCTSVLISPHPQRHWLFFFFFFTKVAILIGMRWYFTLVLIYLSIVIHEVEHFSYDNWPLCKSSLQKYLLQFFRHFLIRFFCCQVIGVIYILWIIVPYQIYDLKNVILSYRLSFTLHCWLCL